MIITVLSLIQYCHVVIRSEIWIQTTVNTKLKLKLLSSLLHYKLSRHWAVYRNCCNNKTSKEDFSHNLISKINMIIIISVKQQHSPLSCELNMSTTPFAVTTFWYRCFASLFSSSELSSDSLCSSVSVVWILPPLTV